MSCEGVEGCACERGGNGYEVAVMSFQRQRPGGGLCGHDRWTAPGGGRGQSLTRKPCPLCAWEDY